MNLLEWHIIYHVRWQVGRESHESTALHCNTGIVYRWLCAQAQVALEAMHIARHPIMLTSALSSILYFHFQWLWNWVYVPNLTQPPCGIATLDGYLYRINVYRMTIWQNADFDSNNYNNICRKYAAANVGIGFRISEYIYTAVAQTECHCETAVQ